MLPVNRGFWSGLIQDECRHPAVHVPGRTFVGRTQVELGPHGAGLVAVGHHRRGHRVADTDHRVAPTEALALGRHPHAESAVDLTLTQPGDRGVDVPLHLSDGVGVGLGANGRVHQGAHRLRQRLVDTA
jgi:hypothetical protein